MTPLSALLPICLVYLGGGEEVLAGLFLWIHDSVPTLFSHIRDGFHLPTGLEMKEAWRQGLLWDYLLPHIRWPIVLDAVWSWDSSPSGVSQGVSFYLGLFFPLNPWCFRILGGRRIEWEMDGGWRRERNQPLPSVYYVPETVPHAMANIVHSPKSMIPILKVKKLRIRGNNLVKATQLINHPFGNAKPDLSDFKPVLLIW